jgi:hypothetical protein
MDCKDIKVTSLTEGMSIVNLGVVSRIEEYSNVVLVFFSFKRFKADEDHIVFSPFERVTI